MLSAEERRRLARIERELSPQVISGLDWTLGARRQRVAWTATLLLCLLVTISALALHPVVSMLGFVLMLIAANQVIGAWRPGVWDRWMTLLQRATASGRS